MAPRRLKTSSYKEELLLAASGLSGIAMYYLLEYEALLHTMASNVGVIIAAAPFFTAILGKLFGVKAKQSRRFYLGFVIAMAGICLLSFGEGSVEFHLTGDLLALIAAVVWAVYSNLSRKVMATGHNIILLTRRMFFYGILFLLPAAFMTGWKLDPSAIKNPVIAANILFLGVIGCAVCFVTWNFAVKEIGAVMTSIYIYLTPVVTVLSSYLILKERMAPLAGFGMVLTMAGLLLSEDQLSIRKQKKAAEAA
jgi:drug/metabolite transporter (DMT)-like permease